MVYLVFFNPDWMRKELVGVFATEAKAKAWLANAVKDYGWLPYEVDMATIEEWEIG